MSAEKRLRQLGIELPEAPSPLANYVNAVRVGNLLFLSGKGPSAVDGLRPAGKLGREFNLEQGYRFARSTGLAMLAVVGAPRGLPHRDRPGVERPGTVNTPPYFAARPEGVNVREGKVDQKVFLGECVDFQVKLGGRTLLSRRHPSLRTPIGHAIFVRLDKQARRVKQEGAAVEAIRTAGGALRPIMYPNIYDGVPSSEEIEEQVQRTDSALRLVPSVYTRPDVQALLQKLLAVEEVKFPSDSGWTPRERDRR